MMENDAHYTLVGSIVLAVGLLLAASFVWIMGGADKTSYRHYAIYFYKESINGVDVNTPVKLRGIEMGEVTSFKLIPGKREAVRVDIKLDRTAPIHIDSQAYIKRSLVTSLATIEIRNPDGSSPLLADTASKGRYPVIAEGSSEMDQATSSLGQMAKNGAEVLGKLNRVLSGNNRASFSATLHNLQTLSGELVAHKKTLDDTLLSFKASADAISRTADSVEQTSTNFDREMQTLSGNANTAFSKANSTLGNLQQQSVIISKQLQLLANTATYQMNQISHDVNNSANTITSTGQILSNPRELIFDSGKPAVAPGE
ncbi:MAG: MlaD family protein [Sulfuriferula sp.]